MKTEKVFVMLFIISIILNLAHMGGAIILVISMAALSFLYFFGAFYFFSVDSLKNQQLVMSIISGIMLSVAPVSFVFKLQYWPGAGVLSLSAVIFSCSVLIAAILLKMLGTQRLKHYYNNMIIRSSVLLAVSTILFITPVTALVRIEYWNNPQMAHIAGQYFSHPENDSYRAKYERYIERNSK